MDVVGIIIAVAAAGIVVLSMIYNIKRSRQGKSSCGCDCSDKNSCMGCAKFQETQAE